MGSSHLPPNTSINIDGEGERSLLKCCAIWGSRGLPNTGPISSAKKPGKNPAIPRTIDSVKKSGSILICPQAQGWYSDGSPGSGSHCHAVPQLPLPGAPSNLAGSPRASLAWLLSCSQRKQRTQPRTIRAERSHCQSTHPREARFIGLYLTALHLNLCAPNPLHSRSIQFSSQSRRDWQVCTFP